MDYRPHNRIRHGAALIYVLAIVTIVALLALGVANLVVTHYSTEQSLAGYSRAYYIAESAANWQLNRMSRLDPNANSTTPVATGRLPLSAVIGFPSGLFSPYDDSNIPLQGFPGMVSITLTNVNQSTPVWDPHFAQFILTVMGQDTPTGIVRGLTFMGAATGLANRYSLYGLGGISFNSAANGGTTFGIPPTTGPNSSSQYIGTDGTLTCNSPPPTIPANSVFGGCRLGPVNGSAGGNVDPLAVNRFSNWDIVRLPAPVRWPTVSEVENMVWGNGNQAMGPPSNYNSNSTQITYRQQDGTYVPFANPVTELTDAEFSNSNYMDANGNLQRTIRLAAMASSPTNGFNVFYFTNIQMKPYDVLVLDLENAIINTSINTSIRILIENATAPIQLTNLAYSQNSASSHFYLWFNNSNQPFSYRPVLPTTTIDSTNNYAIQPQLYGLVYGVNPNSAPSSNAGDISIDGSVQPVSVDVLVGNHLLLNGNITVNNNANVENPYDPDRYVLYYRITSTLQENNSSGSSYHQSVIGYGNFP